MTFLSGQFICLCRDSDAAEPEQPAAEARPRLDDTEPPPMLIHRTHDQEADEVMPARRLESVPTDIGLAHPAALIANSRQDFHRPAGLGSSRQGPGGTGWLVAQLPSVSGFACGRPARITSLNSHASPDSSQFEANVYAYAVTACP